MHAATVGFGPRVEFEVGDRDGVQRPPQPHNLGLEGGDALIAGIRTAASGESAWTRDELRRVTGALATPRLTADVEVPLTQRESEVLRQLAYGLTNKEIAQTLHISYETVKEHVQHILRKIGVSDRTQAAVWAVRQGLVE